MKPIRFAPGCAALLAALLSLSACDRAADHAATDAAVSAANPAAAASSAPASAPTAAPPAAWLTDRAAYPLVNTTAPAFAADLNAGGKTTSDAALRGHWTILLFWGLWSDDAVADARYVRALTAAADADPDLDFLSVHTPPGHAAANAAADAAANATADAAGSPASLNAWFKSQGAAWPTVLDADGRIAAAYRVTSVPTYLLIGPDLTIEAYRGQLAATPDDGIKSVIKGYAEIRKQVASPD